MKQKLSSKLIEVIVEMTCTLRNGQYICCYGFLEEYKFYLQASCKRRHCHGGNLNCTTSTTARDSYLQTHACFTGGGEYRCSGPGYSLHFHPPDASGQLTFHMDSANSGFLKPWSVQFPGVLEHFGLDVLGGNTIFNSGVPH